MAKTYDITMPDGTVKKGVSVDEATKLSNSGGKISVVNNPTEQAKRSSVTGADKQYVNQATGAVTTTSGAKPKGTVEYTPDMGTSLKGIQGATGYADRLKKVQEQTNRETLSSNAKKAASAGYTGEQIIDFTKGVSSPGTVAPLGTPTAERKSVPTLSTPEAVKTSTEPSSDYTALLEQQQSEKDEYAQGVADRQKQLFMDAFEQTQNRLDLEGQALTRSAREQEAQLRTADTMAKAEMEDIRAMSGVRGGASAAQDTIAQNVITQGARSAQSAQEMALRADIEQRISEAQQLRDQGIATAESERELAVLENRLATLDAMAEQQLLAEERIRAEEATAVAQARQDALSTIGASYADYQAKINELANDNDPTNDWLIPYYEQARQEKIASQGLDQSGQPLTTGPQYTISQALEAYRMGIRSPEVLETLNASGYNVGTGGVGSGGVITTTTPPVTTGADAYIKKQDMVDRLSRRNLSVDDTLRLINQYADFYVGEYGQDVVESVVNDLIASQQAVPETEAPVSEELQDIGTYINETYGNNDAKRSYIANRWNYGNGDITREQAEWLLDYLGL